MLQNTDSGNLGAHHGEAEGRLYRFLRYSHIFSAGIREIIETKFLSELNGGSLTLPQFHLVKLICLNGHHQLREVAGILGVSAPAATKNIDKLERLGLVHRRPCRGDRRATLLSATEKARSLVRRYDKLTETRLEPLLQAFEHQEIEGLIAALERFSVLLFTKEGADNRLCLRCAAYGMEGCPIGRNLGHCPYVQFRTRGNPKRLSEEDSV